jgi:hypothetical protein
MPLRIAGLVLFVLVPGILVTAGSAWFLAYDWAALISAFRHFELIAPNADLRAVSIANDLQVTYRINCFADGVGVLVGLLLWGLGIHGLCLLPHRPTTSAETSPRNR